MSDTAPGPDAQVVAAPAPLTTPEVTPAASAAPETPPEHPETDSNWFPRSYVEELRNESKTKREAAAPFEEAFAGLHETDRNAVLDFARTLKADPAAAGGMAKQFADLLTAQEQAAVNRALDPNDPTATVSVAQVQQMLDAREKQVQEQAAIDAVFAHARDLGYDPDTPRGGYLLLEAWKNHDGDLAKAAEALKAEGQQQVDTFVQGKREEAKKAPVTPGGATPPGTTEPVRTMKDAEAAMRARLTRQLVGEGR